MTVLSLIIGRRYISKVEESYSIDLSMSEIYRVNKIGLIINGASLITFSKNKAAGIIINLTYHKGMLFKYPATFRFMLIRCKICRLDFASSY